MVLHREQAGALRCREPPRKRSLERGERAGTGRRWWTVGVTDKRTQVTTNETDHGRRLGRPLSRQVEVGQGDMGSHAVDCYPGGCPFRVYVRDGKIVREQSGTLRARSGVPDTNPMGCQKAPAGATSIHCSPDRVTQALKRVWASVARGSSSQSPGTRR